MAVHNLGSWQKLTATTTSEVRHPTPRPVTSRPVVPTRRPVATVGAAQLAGVTEMGYTWCVPDSTADVDWCSNMMGS